MLIYCITISARMSTHWHHWPPPAWSPNRVKASAAVGRDRCRLVSSHLHPLQTSLCWVPGLAAARSCWILAVCAVGCLPKVVLCKKVKHVSTCHCCNYCFQSLLVLKAIRLPAKPLSPSIPMSARLLGCFVKVQPDIQPYSSVEAALGTFLQEDSQKPRFFAWTWNRKWRFSNEPSGLSLSWSLTLD